jgi:hypothetical protein
LEATSRFGEDRWDLRAAILQKQGKALALDFATVPPRYQATARELFYLLLAGPHPHGVAELSISTIRQKFSALASFWHWLDARPASAAPSASVPAVSDLEDYHRHLLATTRTRGPRANYLFCARNGTRWWRADRGPVCQPAGAGAAGGS